MTDLGRLFEERPEESRFDASHLPPQHRRSWRWLWRKRQVGGSRHEGWTLESEGEA